MKKIATAALIAVTALAANSTFANTATQQSDAATAHKNTAKVRTITYKCQNNQKVTVKYGFNKRNQPTFAEAVLEGKKRFMPINNNLSDAASTHFGDDNNFSLGGEKMTRSTVRKPVIQIQSPSSEILYKLCKAV